MFQFPSPPPRNRWIAAAASLAVLSGHSLAQNFTMQVADSNPLGIGSFVPELDVLDFGVADGVKGEFSFGLGVETTFDSNIYLEEDDTESQMYTAFSPHISYTTDPEGGAPISLVASYNPSFTHYFGDSDLDAFDQAGDFTLSILGNRTELALFGRYMAFTGSDSLTGDFVEGTVMTGGLRGIRRIGTRTALNAGWSMSASDYGDSINEGSEIYSSYIGGMWEASARTSIGSTLRYTLSESDNLDSQDALALLFEARYRLGERIWFSASLGPEFASGSDSVQLAGDLAAGYRINELWTWTNIFRAASVPAPDEQNYVIYDMRLASTLTRQLNIGSIGSGVDISVSQYEGVDTVTVERDDERNVGIFVNYQRPLFSERVAFDSSVRYKFNDGQSDWDQWMVSAAFNVAF